MWKDHPFPSSLIFLTSLLIVQVTPLFHPAGDVTRSQFVEEGMCYRRAIALEACGLASGARKYSGDGGVLGSS